MFSLRQPTPGVLARILTEQAAMELTYDEVGATRSQPPPGYRHDHWEVDLGDDDGGVFDRAAAALWEWAPQRGAGLRVFPGDPAANGATFVLVIPMPVGFATAAGRVVDVVDEPDRAGFTYGTLPGHPEQGEEAFTVVRENGRVSFQLVAFSRPHHPLARAGAVFTRFLQLRTNRAYLDVMRGAVDAG